VKQCQVSTTRHVIEGAKSIGAGAATIALAGAAVGIGIIWTIFPSVIPLFIANLKKRILNVSSFFDFLQLKYPYWIFFF
jgi:hypothetical protein